MKKLMTIGLTLMIVLNINTMSMAASNKVVQEQPVQEEVIIQYEVTDLNYNV